MLSLDELVTEISGKSGKAEDDIKALIKEKQTELSDLVSAEGAAYIVGRELGVELIKDTRRDLKIENILPDMRNVDVKARVASVFEPREFQRNGKTGKVANVTLSDDTGTIRLPLWNDEIGIIESTGLSQGDLVEVTGAWSKRDNYRDTAELRLGKRGKITKLESGPGELPPKGGGSGQPAQQPAIRTEIKDLKPGASVIVKGCLIQVYKKKPYYDICPQCGKSVKEENGSFVCRDHGFVQPTFSLLLSGVIDDGTGNIRAVFFRDSAEKLFGKSAQEVKSSFDSAGIDGFWEGFPSIGKDIMVEGRVKISDFTKEAEILANSVTEVNAREEAANILKGIDS